MVRRKKAGDGRAVEENSRDPSPVVSHGEEPEHPPTPDIPTAKSMEPTESETETDAHFAPSIMQQEEDKLRKEREEVNKKEIKEILKVEEDGTLDDGSFKKLEALIEKTNAYSEFLHEQMNDDADRLGKNPTEGSGESSTPQKGKRKANAIGGAKKRAKTNSATQDFLPLMKAELRDYQIKGVKWLASLYNNGINGILGDQMGLGKTIQTIGFLSYLRMQETYGPFMVLGPLSTLTNWVNEFERFCPDIKAVMYHGAKKDRLAMLKKDFKNDGRHAGKDFPVMVTSYEIVMADIKLLQKFNWKFIIVDEGHRLKNFDCKLMRELKTLNCQNRLILSGTPLQNNLSELWSLLNFLLPDIFVSAESFESWFDFGAMHDEDASASIVAKEQRNKIVTKLHTILKPFLLRRIKSDVENSLPAKKEMILYAHMTDHQKAIDKKLRDRTLDEAMKQQQKEEGGRQPPTAKLNNMIMQMRKNCNHPDLVTSAYSNDVVYPSSKELLDQCGKLQLLNRLLIKLKAKGHRVLIFSQMTKMLDILDTFLEQEGHKSCRLDGSVKWQDRQKAMESFKSSQELFVFLLSTRAGGLGINLTSADTVIIYDSDWNPHQDLQAMDRAHRIGQENPVLVLRLATGNSVDGRMLKRANSKLMLERLVIRKGAFLPGQAKDSKDSNLTSEELMELLKDTMPLQNEPQSGVISDKMMDKLLDRKHLIEGKSAPYKTEGVGYEVVKTPEGAGLLQTVQ